MYSEDELLPLSALQHLLFCERQCALIHVEQAWHENRLTVEGRLLHDHVHERNNETRGGVRIVRGLRLKSLRLGVAGVVSREANELGVLRGLEGDAGRVYFGVCPHLVTSQKNEFPFQRRTRRPPTDNMNALLSFLYTLLVHDCTGALETVGLDPQVGFLHRERPGRPLI